MRAEPGISSTNESGPHCLPPPWDEEEDGKIVVVFGLEPPQLVLHLSMISIEASSAFLHFRNPAHTAKFYVYSDQIN